MGEFNCILYSRGSGYAVVRLVARQTPHDSIGVHVQWVNLVIFYVAGDMNIRLSALLIHLKYIDLKVYGLMCMRRFSVYSLILAIWISYIDIKVRKL